MSGQFLFQHTFGRPQFRVAQETLVQAGLVQTVPEYLCAQGDVVQELVFQTKYIRASFLLGQEDAVQVNAFRGEIYD